MYQLLMAVEMPNWATMVYGGACIVAGFYVSKLVPAPTKSVGRHRADRVGKA